MKLYDLLSNLKIFPVKSRKAGCETETMPLTGGALLNRLELSDCSVEELEPVPTVGPVFAIRMSGDRSFDRWYHASQHAVPLKYVALGVGDGEALDRLKEDISFFKEEILFGEEWDLSKNLKLAVEFDFELWFRERRAELEEYSGLPRGSWPRGVESSSGFWFPFDGQGNHLNPLWMILVPAEEPWQAPLSLAYGSWNDCPAAHIHAALARRWANLYGASLVAIGPDTLEFLVERPPDTKEQAIKLAIEHYLYCPDIVDQGCGTIDKLAALVKGGSTWSFWWD